MRRLRWMALAGLCALTGLSLAASSAHAQYVPAPAAPRYYTPGPVAPGYGYYSGGGYYYANPGYYYASPAPAAVARPASGFYSSDNDWPARRGLRLAKPWLRPIR
jgi:hypothetical protein